jgi:hypothetical protein
MKNRAQTHVSMLERQNQEPLTNYPPLTPLLCIVSKNDYVFILLIYCCRRACIFQRVQDYTNYFLNLTHANLYGEVTWQKEYSAKVSSIFLINFCKRTTLIFNHQYQLLNIFIMRQRLVNGARFL